MEALTIKKQLSDYLQGAKDALKRLQDEAEKYAEYYTERGYIADARDMDAIRDEASECLTALHFEAGFLEMLIEKLN